MSNSHGWVGVDLDGTLAVYTEWKGIDHIGEPVPAMILRVRRWLVAGKNVKIFTARVWPLGEIRPDDRCEQFVGSNERENEAMKAAVHIRAWCEKHLGAILPITCAKDFAMFQLWDDRCVQIEPNTGRRLDGIDDLK